MPLKALVAPGIVLLWVLCPPVLLPHAAAYGAQGIEAPVQNTSPGSDPKSSETLSPAKAPLTLVQALERTLDRHPQLAAKAREIEARHKDETLAGLSPDPEISIELDNLGGSGPYSGAESLETTLRLSRTVELGGKRSARAEVGRLETEEARRRHQLSIAEALKGTRQRYAEVQAASAWLELRQLQFDLAGQMLDAARERVEAGRAAALDVLRFESLAAEARLGLERARQELEAARLALALGWGDEAADFGGLEDTSDALPELPERRAVLEACAAGPGAGLQRAAVEQAEGRVKLERAGAVPDLTLGLGARHERESGESALLAELSFSLPVSGAAGARTEAARLRRAAAQDEANAARLQEQAEASVLWSALKSGHAEAHLLREEMLPRANRTLEAMMYGYKAGKFGVLEVMEAQREAFDVMHRYTAMLLDIRRNQAALDALMGINPIPLNDK